MSDAEAGTDIHYVLFEKFCFSPAHLRVPRGTTVRWVNMESKGDAGESHVVAIDTLNVESSQLRPGESFRHTFEKKGMYPVYCSNYVWITGTVEVCERLSPDDAYALRLSDRDACEKLRASANAATAAPADTQAKSAAKAVPPQPLSLIRNSASLQDQHTNVHAQTSAVLSPYLPSFSDKEQMDAQAKLAEAKALRERADARVVKAAKECHAKVQAARAAARAASRKVNHTAGSCARDPMTCALGDTTVSGVEGDPSDGSVGSARQRRYKHAHNDVDNGVADREDDEEDRGDEQDEKRAPARDIGVAIAAQALLGSETSSRAGVAVQSRGCSYNIDGDGYSSGSSSGDEAEALRSARVEEKLRSRAARAAAESSSQAVQPVRAPLPATAEVEEGETQGKLALFGSFGFASASGNRGSERSESDGADHSVSADNASDGPIGRIRAGLQSPQDDSPLASSTVHSIGLSTSAATPRSVLLRDFAFKPGALDVEAGGTVAFRVSSRAMSMVEHELVVLDESGARFAVSPVMTRGGKFRIMVPARPGATLCVRCGVFADMSPCVIRVVPAGSQNRDPDASDSAPSSPSDEIDGVRSDSRGASPVGIGRPSFVPRELSAPELMVPQPWRKEHYVQIKNFRLQPRQLCIRAGESVRWCCDEQNGADHTIECTGHFESGVLQPGDQFGRVFDLPGTFVCFDPAYATTMGAMTLIVEVMPVSPKEAYSWCASSPSVSPVDFDADGAGLGRSHEPAGTRGAGCVLSNPVGVQRGRSLARRSRAPPTPVAANATASTPPSAKAKLFGSFDLPGRAGNTSISGPLPVEHAARKTGVLANSSTPHSSATRPAVRVLGGSRVTAAAPLVGGTDEIHTIVAQLNEEEMAKKLKTKGKKRGKKKAGEKKKELRRRRADRALHAAVAASTAATMVAHHAANAANAAAVTASTAPALAASTAAVAASKVAAHDAAKFAAEVCAVAVALAAAQSAALAARTCAVCVRRSLSVVAKRQDKRVRRKSAQQRKSQSAAGGGQSKPNLKPQPPLPQSPAPSLPLCKMDSLDAAELQAIRSLPSSPSKSPTTSRVDAKAGTDSDLGTKTREPAEDEHVCKDKGFAQDEGRGTSADACLRASKHEGKRADRGEQQRRASVRHRGQGQLGQKLEQATRLALKPEHEQQLAHESRMPQARAQLHPKRAAVSGRARGREQAPEPESEPEEKPQPVPEQKPEQKPARAPKPSLERSSRFDDAAALVLLRHRWHGVQLSLATAKASSMPCAQKRPCPFLRMFAEASAAFDRRAAKRAAPTAAQPAGALPVAPEPAGADGCASPPAMRAGVHAVGRPHSQRTRGRRGGSRRVKTSGAAHGARSTPGKKLAGAGAAAQANVKQQQHNRQQSQGGKKSRAST